MVLGSGWEPHAVLVTDSWSKPLLVTGVEAKAWPGVGTLWPLHIQWDIWFWPVVQITLPELTSSCQEGISRQEGSLENAGLCYSLATSLACGGQHLTSVHHTPWQRRWAGRGPPVRFMLAWGQPIRSSDLSLGLTLLGPKPQTGFLINPRGLRFPSNHSLCP